MMTPSDSPASRTSGAVKRIADICAWLADLGGHFSAAVLLVLTVSIVLGITLRWIGIDNSWTYDLDLFTLTWVAFSGAGFTALRGHHVTAGIALENVLGGRGTVLNLIRFLIVFGFLILFLISGYWQAKESLLTNKTTLDIAQWHVWIAQASLPVGAGLWALAEAAKFFRGLPGSGSSSQDQDKLPDRP